MTRARLVESSPERRVTVSIPNHLWVIDYRAAILEMRRLRAPLLWLPAVNPLVAQVVRRAKKTVREIQHARSGAPPTTSPYVQWHGPSASAQFGLVVSPVADILLLQGSAPAGTPVEIEFDIDGLTLPAPHRFPHPKTPEGDQTCFELTIDSVVCQGATKCRLLTGSHIGDWRSLPSLPPPGGMIGVEELTRCPACRSGELKVAGRRQHLDMATCVRCGLVMTTPRPVEDHTLMRYSERYFADEYLPSQQLSPALSAHIDAILDLAEPARSIHPGLFELGIGGGNLLSRAAERGWNACGSDVNPASIAHATELGLTAWLENSDHADTLRGPYGAVISEMSLEHVRHPEHFCALAADALVPGGRVVIYTVSAEGDSFEHSGMASPLAGPAEHLFLFSAGSLVSLCQRAGLRVENVWRNPSADEIGIVATKRRDVANPTIAANAQTLD